MTSLRDAALWGDYVLGGLSVAGAVGHWFGVVGKALAENRGYDLRLGDMLAIGMLPFLLGAAMLAGAWHARQDAAWGLGLAGTAAGAMAVLLLVLWRTIFVGEFASPLGGSLTVLAFAVVATLDWRAI